MPDPSGAQWTEAQRLASLRRYDILDTPPEAAFEEIVGLAADICDTPMAIISFVDELRQWFKAEHGLGKRETPRAMAICAQAMLHPGLFVVPDLSQDPRFADNPLVTEEPRLRFYASVQLLDRRGLPLGTLSVLDREVRAGGLSDRQSRMLLALGRQVSVELELRLAAAERKLESARFRRLFEQAPILLALCGGPRREFQYANRAFRELVGIADLVGRSLEEALGPLVDGRLLEDVRQVSEAVTPIRRTVEIWDRRKGSNPPVLRWAEIIIQPMSETRGEAGGILFVGSDVTEERAARAHAAVLQNSIEHERQVSAMGMMAKTLAHEINQPFAAAKNYLAAARMATGDAPRDGSARAGELIGLAEEQLLRAGRIIHGVRNLVGNSPARREIVQLGGLVSRVTALLEATEAPVLPPINPIVSGGETRVLADPVQVEQVLINLLRNAQQACGEEPEIVITASEQADGFVEICVRDNGPGIPPGAERTLFTGFGPSTSSGLGVGLSICATIVQAHGGSIWAQNDPAGGAAFHFTLPVAADTPAAAEVE